MEAVTKELTMTVADNTKLVFVSTPDGNLRCTCGGSIQTEYTDLGSDAQGYRYMRIDDECTACGAWATERVRRD